jgi:beta-alanine--pyruvate transaminase
MNESRPDSMSSFWMPFTNNRDFKAHPRLLVSAEGMYYKDVDGNSILDGTAGLWCVPCGHAQPKIVAAVRDMVGQLDFAPTFQMGHPAAFDLAEQLMEYTGHKFGHVFYTNSGSEAVDTALKIALAYHKARGDAGRTRLIGRERGYHGVGFGGLSVGGIGPNRKSFGPLLPGVDHLPHTHNLGKNAFSRGEPDFGAELADELERIVALHDASTIAAVIVEPVSGSTGVLVPPKGYLKRLRELCTKHGILLIFDEVITGFGRLTTPFAADYFDVEPDMITTAKGLTNGTVPMGAVFSKRFITTRSWMRRSALNSSTAIPIRATRSPAQLRSPRSRYSRSSRSWSTRKRSSRTGKTRCTPCAGYPMSSISARSASWPASSSNRSRGSRVRVPSTRSRRRSRTVC